MNIVYLLLGSNLNDRPALLQRARSGISSRIGNITKESSLYESEPWGFDSDMRFLNQVIRVETNCSPLNILDEILKIESELGRIRKNNDNYSSRTMDIDILFFNDEIINEINLTIPHPRIQERMFTLLPLSEISRSIIHPGSLKSVDEMISECEDQLDVHPYHP